MKSLRKKIREFFKDDTGGALLVATPFFSVLFMLLLALVFNVAIWLQKRQELQFIADAASRAGTLAIEYRFPVLEDNGKYHVYCMLNEQEATINAVKVLQANEMNLKGMRVTTRERQPAGFKSPEWSSRDHRYYDKWLSVKEQYQNGDFSMYLEADADGIWTKLLGTSEHIKVKAYAQSMASGSASR